jgi:hypothetical protein
MLFRQPGHDSVLTRTDNPRKMRPVLAEIDKRSDAFKQSPPIVFGAYRCVEKNP